MNTSYGRWIGLLLGAISPVYLSAQIFSYEFADVTTTSGLSSSGAVASNVNFSSFTAVGTPSNPNASGRFSFTDWSTGATTGTDTFTGGIALTEYYEFTITPVAGYTVTLTSISFVVQRSGTGIRQYSVRSGLDGYASNLSASISPSNADLSVVGGNVFQVVDTTTLAEAGSTVTLTSGYVELTTATTFRLYGFNAEASGGTFSVDSVAIFGSSAVDPSAVPEPSTYAVILGGLACAAVAMRRRRFMVKEEY